MCGLFLGIIIKYSTMYIIKFKPGMYLGYIWEYVMYRLGDVCWMLVPIDVSYGRCMLAAVT